MESSESPLSLSPIKHVDSPSMMTSAIETEVNEVASLRERLDVFTCKAAEFKKDKEKLEIEVTLQKSMSKQMEQGSEQLKQQNAELSAAKKDAEQSSQSLRVDLGNRRTEVAALRKELGELRSRLSKVEGESVESKKALAVAVAGARRDVEAANAVKQQLADAEVKAAAAEAAVPPSPLPSADERIISTTAELEERYQTEMRTFEQTVREKYDDLASLADHKGSILKEQVDSLEAENSMLRLKQSEGTLNLATQQSQIAVLEARVKTLEASRAAESSQLKENKLEYQLATAELKQQLETKIDEYMQLQDTTQQLRNAVDKFDSKLATGEATIGIPATPSSSAKDKRKRLLDLSVDNGSEIPLSGKKMKLVKPANFDVQTLSCDLMHIDEINVDGFFVNVKNIQSDTTSIDGWSLGVDAPGVPPQKFPLTGDGFSDLAAGSILTIWSKEGWNTVGGPANGVLLAELNLISSAPGSAIALFDADGQEQSRAVVSLESSGATGSGSAPAPATPVAKMSSEPADWYTTATPGKGGLKPTDDGCSIM